MESGACKVLEGWKNVSNDDKGKIVKDLGKEALTGVIISRMHVKRSRSSFEE